MVTINYRGRLIEITVVGDTINDQLVLECWDLTPGSGGMLFTIARDQSGVLTVTPAGQPIALDLLERVAAIAGKELTEQ